ncbi:PepSY domain-containing protein [Acinetobacter sp. WZC-1]|uniref:PepSY domain-containing protein n=1 Tax=Acinetobacter sp. WZC-1 TaxID=3459034 RepID=UPI00403D99DC
MLKKFFFQIHWFLGITAGLVLSIMGVTGAIYSYDEQILKWMNTESYIVTVENREKLTPAELYQHFQQQHPEMKINSITIATAPEQSSSINIVKEGERRGYNMMVNPYNAAVLPEIKGQAFFRFVLQIHRTLTAGPIGKQITGACTLMLIFFVLSGLYLRWPKKHKLKQWLAIKPQLKGRNFLWDLHAVAGTWVIVFYLLLACTGLFWSYDWWRSGMFKVLGVERSTFPGPGGRPPPGLLPPGSPPPGSLPPGAARPSSPPAAGPANRPGMVRGTNPERGSRIGREKMALQPAQIHFALNQSWTGFNDRIGRDYSSITLLTPQKPGVVDIFFVDAIPQHERSRNKASYNYQTLQIENLELYQDKKLNEKIMGSMLAVHRGSFFGPIYQFLAMLASLIMPLFFITGWMLYLKRRKQKKLTSAARNATSIVQIDPDATPWLISYASQTGVSEQLAWRTATSLQEAHQPVTVKSVQQLTADDLSQNSRILFIASTYGTGEAPDLALSFEKKFLHSQMELSHLSYGVLALGSKEYPDSYCSFGHRIDAWLQQNGAQQLFATIEVDNASNHDIQKWNNALAESTRLQLHAMSIDKVFDSWTLIRRDLLNPGSLGEPAYNIELQAAHEASWHAGDIAEIQPGNSTARIQAFLEKLQIAADTPVDSLQQSIQQVLWNRDLTVELMPFTGLEQLLEQLPVLPAREYSIASIPSQQVLRLVVRQQTDTQGEIGLGSGWLTRHVQLRDKISLRIRTNESFHLIADNRPIICIGNGTGIAGLMSLIAARVRADYVDNWLIFGERQQRCDYFYRDIIQNWQNTAMLKRLDLAFSRDQTEKVYVHHKLREQADEFKRWIANGAVIYVCGSIQGMASDVNQALVDLLGEAQVDELRQQGRYRRDVY